jgi:hypothetical protein
MVDQKMGSAIVVGAIAALGASAACADVVIEERMSVSGAGLMAFGNMSGTTRTIIASDRARTESNLEFESGMMRAIARGAGQSIEIVRLDQDRIYVLDPRRRTYTETTFAEQRAQMQQIAEKTRQAQAAQQAQSSGVDASQCEWGEPTMDVQRNGEKATVAGYEAERIVVTAKQPCRDRRTGQVCEFGLTLDQWLAPTFDAVEETLAYLRAYTEKLGLSAAASKDFAERAETMFGSYEAMWKEIAANTRHVEGYPVKSSFVLAVGGEQCTNDAAQASTQPAPTMSSALGDALGGLFGGGRKRRSEPVAPQQTAPSGLIPLMSVSSELVSVSKAPAGAELFEIPAGYKKSD